MNFLLLFFVLIFGTLIGSFLNVVILRYNTGKNIFAMGERSMCFSCGKTLCWFELVPVLSFLIQRARCRGCRSKISWQYPLVELATGAFFVAIFAKNFLFDSHNVLGSLTLTSMPIPMPMLTSMLMLITGIQLVIWSILMVITVYDLRHKIIPDGLVYSFIGLSAVHVWLFPGVLAHGILDAVIAAVVFFSFFAGLYFVSGGRWLGFGDAKLVVGVGLFLGLARGVSALALAFWIGAAVSIAVIFGGKLFVFVASRPSAPKVIRESRLRERLNVLTMKSEIPFAPFIILGTLIAFFFSFDIFQISQFMYLFASLS